MIRKLRFEDLPAAIGVVARGMRDNPLNVAALGGDDGGRLACLQEVFSVSLPLIFSKGLFLGAFEGKRLVGVAGGLPPGLCQLSIGETVGLLPGLVAATGLSKIAHFASWMSEWKSRDLHEPHWHLGPVAVDARAQGHGMGGDLIAEYCRMLDRTKAVGYLETDKAENVEFYEKFGFQVVGEAEVLGTRNWFLRR